MTARWQSTIDNESVSLDALAFERSKLDIYICEYLHGSDRKNSSNVWGHLKGELAEEKGGKVSLKGSSLKKGGNWDLHLRKVETKITYQDCIRKMKNINFKSHQV